MPLWWRIHCKASTRAVNIFGAERSQNGNTLSTYNEPSQCTPSRCRSSVCTGTILYASFPSVFTNKDPLPREATKAARWSIEEYASDTSTGSIPLLTLLFSEEDKSTMKRHFPGLFFLKIRPSGLMCKPFGHRLTGIGHRLTGIVHILRSITFLLRYSVTVCGLCTDRLWLEPNSPIKPYCKSFL